VEQSAAVVYLGPTPSQQILPALRWLTRFEGRRRWFLVGSDYVFPHTANAVIKDAAGPLGCEVVGEAYLPLSGGDAAAVVRRIADDKPNLILNTINGDANVAFFRALRQGETKSIPALSFSISEEELRGIGPRDTAGDYLAASYFQSIESPANREFVERFARRYSAGRVVSAPMQAAYCGVHLWAKAVAAAGRDDPAAIRTALKGQEYDAPQGAIRIDPATRHTVQTARVGRVDLAGRIAEVYQSPEPIDPAPFPPPRTREEWLGFLAGLQAKWGGRWSNPGR
jgi:urea transport system substrate-binding protein